MKKYLLLIFILFLIIGSFLAVFFHRMIFFPSDPFLEKEIIFNIEKGTGSKEIALNLEKEELIKCALAFRAYVLTKGIAGNLRAGDYILSPSMNIPEIADKLVRGETAKVSVTIPEGFTVRQIEERLGLKLPVENLEGFLFPDTYQFSINFGGEEVVKKMRDNFEKKIAPYQDKISNSEMALFEIITMASLIEKEVRTLEDKKIVSGILWKRLDINMPLQVDATIAYLYERENWTFDEMRRKIALLRDIDSPYNTYKYRGLPAGPICNPGLESIIAAIYPEKSDYWYYLSTPEGKTIFSKILQEHNSAKAKYFN